MTTASKITLVRVVLIPVYMVLMLLSANGADWLRWAAVAVFVIASISDFLDGYIAATTIRSAISANSSTRWPISCW